MFKVTFGDGKNSQEETDPRKERITDVSGEREQNTAVCIEDGFSGTKQGAHCTAHIVLLAAVERLPLGTTWLGAWEQLRVLWLFTAKLKDAWYAQPALAAQANKRVKANLNLRLDKAAQEIEERHLVREGIPLRGAWIVEPTEGTSAEKRTARKYYRSEAEASAASKKTGMGKPQEWKPNLGSAYVDKLTTCMWEWIQTRSVFPWTSYAQKSGNKGESAAVTYLDNAVSELHPHAQLSETQAEMLAKFMLVTFDFAPSTLDVKNRNLHHAAGVAARHVVEHFQFCPDINPTWRDDLAKAFLAGWKARIEVDASSQASKDLKSGWETVAADYQQYVTAFSGALTTPKTVDKSGDESGDESGEESSSSSSSGSPVVKVTATSQDSSSEESSSSSSSGSPVVKVTATSQDSSSEESSSSSSSGSPVVKVTATSQDSSSEESSSSSSSSEQLTKKRKLPAKVAPASSGTLGSPQDSDSSDEPPAKKAKPGGSPKTSSTLADDIPRPPILSPHGSSIDGSEDENAPASSMSEESVPQSSSAPTDESSYEMPDDDPDSSDT